MRDEKAQEIRERLEKRQQRRENAACDSALSGAEDVPDWPCILWADHRGAHIYDTSIDADADLADLLAERDRLLAALDEATDDARAWGSRLTETCYALASVEEIGEWTSMNDIDERLVDHIGGKIQRLERENSHLTAEREKLLEWKLGMEQMHWPEEAHRLLANNTRLRVEREMLLAVVEAAEAFDKTPLDDLGTVNRRRGEMRAAIRAYRAATTGEAGR